MSFLVVSLLLLWVSVPRDALASEAGVSGDPTPARQLAAKKGKKGKKAKKPTPNKNKGECTQGHPKIEEIGPNTYRIERSLLDYYSGNLNRLSTLGWSRKYNNEEKGIKGWHIGGFKCGAVLYSAGFRPRDAILSVNGMPTSNLVQIYAAQRKLKHRKRYKVVVWRRGQRTTLYYQITG